MLIIISLTLGLLVLWHHYQVPRKQTLRTLNTPLQHTQTTQPAIIMLNNEEIEWVDIFKYLGIHINKYCDPKIMLHNIWRKAR